MYDTASRVRDQQRTVTLREDALGTLQTLSRGSNSRNVELEALDRIHSSSPSCRSHPAAHEFMVPQNDCSGV